MTEPAVPEPSALPPNPSVGELTTEIDRARHEAARTMTALTQKLAPPPVHPPTLLVTASHYARRYAGRYVTRVPVPAWIVLFVLFRLWRRHRRARR